MKLDYFVSLANEICVRDLRLKKLISNSYRVGSFPFSATAFRAVLQNFIPEHLGLGQGVVLGSDEKNFLSEILLYKKNSFHLYKEGELLVLPAEAILASIIIRSDLSSVNSNLEDWLALSKEISGFSAYFSWDSGVLGMDRAEGLLKDEKEFLGNTFLIPNPESVLVQDEESLVWEKERLTDFLASDNPALASLLYRLHQFLIKHPYLQETQEAIGASLFSEENDAIKLAAISGIPLEKIEEEEVSSEDAIPSPLAEEETELQSKDFSASQLFSVQEEFAKEKEEQETEEAISAKLETQDSDASENIMESSKEEEIDGIAYLDSVLESESHQSEVIETKITRDVKQDEIESKEEEKPLVEEEAVSSPEEIELEPEKGISEEEIKVEAEFAEKELDSTKDSLEEEAEEDNVEEGLFSESIADLPLVNADVEEVELKEEEKSEILQEKEAEHMLSAELAEDQKIDFVSGMPIQDFDSSPKEEEITPISTDLDPKATVEEELVESEAKEKEILTPEKEEESSAEEAEKQEEEILPSANWDELSVKSEEEEFVSPLLDELESTEESVGEFEPESQIDDLKEERSEERLLEAELEEDLNLEELLADVSLEDLEESDLPEDELMAAKDPAPIETESLGASETENEIKLDDAPLFESPIIEEIKEQLKLEEEPEVDHEELPLTEEPVEDEFIAEEQEIKALDESELEEKAEIQMPVPDVESVVNEGEDVADSEALEEEKASSIDPVQKSTLASEVKALSMDAPPIPRKSGLEGKFVPKNRRNMGKKRTPGMGPMKNHASSISPKDRANLDLNKPDSKRAKKAQLYLQENEQGNYPVHLAVINNDLKALKLILREGEQTELKNKKGYTPLHFAAELNLIEIALVLLEQGANVNSRTFIYDAPIHLAVLFDNHEMVRVLIEHGAEVEVRNNRGNTPMHRAARFGSYKSAKLLIDNFADIHARMERDLQPLHLAAWYGNNDMVQLFIDEGAELNAINSDGNTALHFAAFNGQVKIIKTLINNKADTSIENLEGETYLQGINEGYQGQMTAILN